MKKGLLLAGIAALSCGAAAAAIAIDVKPAQEVNAGIAYGSTFHVQMNDGDWGIKAYYTLHLFGGESTGTTFPGIGLGYATGTQLLSVRPTSAEVEAAKGYTHAIICRWSDETCTEEWGRWDYFDSHEMEAEQYNYFVYKQSGNFDCYAAQAYKMMEVIDEVQTGETICYYPVPVGEEKEIPHYAKPGYKQLGISGSITSPTYKTKLIGSVKGDTNLFVHYTAYTESDYNYIYISTVSGYDDMHVYTYGAGKYLGAWPGVAATNATSALNYMSWNQGIIKVAIPNDIEDTKLIISDSTKAVQTANLDLVVGAHYSWDGTNGAVVTPSEEHGHAAAYCFDLSKTVQAVAAEGDILAGSVCGVSKEDATALVTRYDTLSEDERLHVNYTTLWTYKHSDTSENVDVSLYHVVNELRRIANNGGSGVSFLGNVGEENTNVMLITLVSAISLAALGGSLILIKKRHSN